MELNDFIQGRIKEDDTFRLTLPEILHQKASNAPEGIAYIFLRDGEEDEERINYKDLHETALHLASHFRELDLKGERALMLYPPGLEFIKALYACFYAGVIAVPAYPPRKNRSLQRIISLVQDSGASVVLSTDEILEAFERSFQDLGELKRLTWLTTNTPGTSTHLTSTLTSPNPPIVQSPNPGDASLLQYTSGSTGLPKGVIVTHQNIMRNLEFLRVAFELSPDSRSVHWLPVFHDMGLIFGVMEPLYCGYTGIIMPPVSFIQKPIRWLKALDRYKATLGGAPNFAYDLCVTGTTDEECAGLRLDHVKSLYNGAEPVRRQTLESFVSKFSAYGLKPEAVYPTYGMAEATLILSGGKVDEKPVYLFVDKHAMEGNRIVVTDEKDENASCQVSVGWPRVDTKIIIVDPETFHPCEDDRIGEIWVSGSIVTKGYWNNPDATDEIFGVFTKDPEEGPFLRTGDLGFYHDGELYISGRLKDLIIIRGRNYYPHDFEHIVESCHPSIRCNASAAFSVEVNNEEMLVIVAEVERTAIRELDVERVCGAIRQSISNDMELGVYAIQLLRTASILKTSSGKIQRKACKEGFLNRTLDVVGESILETRAESPASGIQKTDIITLQAWLMAWIHSRLRISLEKIDLSRSISCYGLNSMKAVRLQQDFLDTFGVNFPPYLFFEKISARELCERALNLIEEGE